MSRLRRPFALGLAVVAAGALALAACAGSGQAVRQPGSAVVTVPAGVSNAYLVLGSDGRVVVVDPGPPGAEARLAEALAEHGRAWSDVSLVVLTHGHADHAGAAAAVAAASGAPVLAGAGDLPLLEAGHHGRLAPQGLEARMILPFLDAAFPPVRPSLLLAAAPGQSSLGLQPYGVDGVAILAPGHTPGSLVVVLDGAAGREALVGDAFRGGVLGGRIDAGTPHRHYFHEDAGRAEGVVDALLAQGVGRFYLGHGGPVTAEAARARFGAAAEHAASGAVESPVAGAPLR